MSIPVVASLPAWERMRVLPLDGWVGISEQVVRSYCYVIYTTCGIQNNTGCRNLSIHLSVGTDWKLLYESHLSLDWSMTKSGIDIGNSNPWLRSNNKSWLFEMFRNIYCNHSCRAMLLCVVDIHGCWPGLLAGGPNQTAGGEGSQYRWITRISGTTRRRGCAVCCEGQTFRG